MTDEEEGRERLEGQEGEGRRAEREGRKAMEEAAGSRQPSRAGSGLSSARYIRPLVCNYLTSCACVMNLSKRDIAWTAC